MFRHPDPERFSIAVIKARISAHNTEYRQLPRYILLGRREYRYLCMELNSPEAYILERATGVERLYGIEILQIDQETFFDVA